MGGLSRPCAPFIAAMCFAISLSVELIDLAPVVILENSKALGFTLPSDKGELGFGAGAATPECCL